MHVVEWLVFWFVIAFTFLVLNILARSLCYRMASKQVAPPVAPKAVETAPGVPLQLALGQIATQGLSLVGAGICRVVARPLESITDEGVSGYFLIVTSDQVFNQVLKPSIESHFGGQS